MEIILRNNYNCKKKINVEEGTIISLQMSNLNAIVNNLLNDYKFININNSQMYFVGENVYEEINLYNKIYNLSLINDVLNILGLDDSFFNKKIENLSYTEKIYLNIIRNLSLDNKKVLFYDVYNYLDYANQKKIKNLLLYLKDKKYIILITSNDVNVLYKLADYSVLWNKNNFEYSKTDDLYSDVEKLLKFKLEVPILSKITYKALKDKNVKLFYSKDVRDIIKDIYKHV